MTLGITILGFSGSYAGPGGACSGYLLDAGESRLWIDCGPGTLANLQLQVETAELDAVLVSHHHPDHFAELPVVYNMIKWYVPRERIPVYAPASVREMADIVIGNPTSDVFDWQVVAGGDRVTIAGVEVVFERTDHTIENLAMRFSSGGRSIVYTGDTGPGWDLAAFAHDADLLVGEATCLAAQYHQALPHISAQMLGDSAAQAGVGLLVPTHIQPGNDPVDHVAEAAAGFGGEVEPPAIGRRYPAG